MDFSLIGLSGRDKRIYETLVAQPQSSIRAVAEATGINRGSVYESIKALLAAGLVTSITIGKRAVYRAKDPEILHEIIAEKQHELRTANASVDDYVRSFAGQASDPSLFHFASFYEGDEGLAAILRDVLKTCRRDHVDEYRSISSPHVSAYLYTNFPHFTHERIRHKLFVRVLRQGNVRGEAAELAESRLISGQSADISCYTLIYSTKVALITINDINQTSGIIIDNAQFAAIQRQLFDTSWQLSVR